MIGGSGTRTTAWTASGAPDRELLGQRIGEVERETPAAPPEDFELIRSILDDTGRTYEEVRDAVSTRLMELYRTQHSSAAFGLLYELNRQHLLQQVTGRLRRYQSRSDPQDVLQEVFFNVYRYPHRFNAQRVDAFRVWTATIVRNTVLKHLRSLSRSGRAEVAFDDLPDQPAPSSPSPLSGAIEQESRHECARVYLTYLQLYLRFYSMLSERERRAIHLVEVEGQSYRAAAADLEIKLENLKMVIFRARRKIHRSMRRVFEGLPPDCRPARDPRPASTPARDTAPGTVDPASRGDVQPATLEALAPSEGLAKDGVK